VGTSFFSSCSHTLLSYTYLLPYPYPTGMRNQISSLSPTSSGIPASSPSLHRILFLNKNKIIFQPQAQCCNALSNKEIMVLDDYGDGEKRSRKCEIWKEKRKAMISECHLKDQDSNYVSEMI